MLLPAAINLSKVLATDFVPEPLDFVLPGLKRGTVGALIGPGGLGKSYWLLAVAASLASGLPLCALTIPPGKVVYLTAEDDASVLHQRIRAVTPAGVAYADNMQLYSGVGCSLDLLNSKFFEELVLVSQGARLVVLDTLSRFHSLDENSTQDMKLVMATLERLAVRTGAAVVYVHHTSKGAALAGQGGLQQAARGSSVLVDNARWASYLAGMTAKEAQRAGLSASKAARYVRWNISKQNYGPPLADQWYVRDEQGALHPVTLESPAPAAARRTPLKPRIGGHEPGW